MEVRSVLVLVVAAVGLAAAGQHDIYSRFSVHGVQLRDRSDVQFLHELELSLDLDIWQHGQPGEREARVMVSPENSVAFLDELDKNGIVHHLEIADVAKSLEEYDADLASYRRNRAGRLTPFDNFPRYDEVMEYIERVAATYPNLVTIVTAGQSYHGRPIKYLKISTTNFEDRSKPIYFMDAMIHAREWVTTPTILYSIHRLVEDLQEQDRDLLEGIDWIILPIVNPDGYEHTHTDARLWRRTRSTNPDPTTNCIGVDANRNFDVNFNTVGVSTNPCSDTYPGATPFSEPETQIVRDMLFEHLDRIQLYMNIHSHGNYVLYGFGNGTVPDNGVALQFVASSMGAAMDSAKLPQAGFYRCGNSQRLLYATSGTAHDYAQEIGVPMSFTLELPGLGSGFQVPPQFINHINAETWLGIAETARLAKLWYTGPYDTSPPEPLPAV